MRMRTIGATLALVVLMLAANVLSASATPATPPFPTKVVKEDRGREVTILSGFDLAEYGGNDTKCTRTELDAVALHEEVGSADEPCKIIVEWSLKDKDATIASGFYAVEPKEWLRFPEPYEAVSGPVRFVGTIWYVPQGWNAHMLAANMAADWQVKNPDLITYVGLSPTDPWVQGLWKAAESGSTTTAAVSSVDGGSNSCVVTSTMAKVNVRSGPGMGFKVVRTEGVGNTLQFVADDGNWKELIGGLFIKSNLCNAGAQADG